MVQDPKKRLTAQQILQHDWMKENGTASDRPLDNVILNRMRGFAGMNKLKKEALKVIATGMSPEEIAGLRALFQVQCCLHQSHAITLNIIAHFRAGHAWLYSRLSISETAFFEARLSCLDSRLLKSALQ